MIDKRQIDTVSIVEFFAAHTAHNMPDNIPQIQKNITNLNQNLRRSNIMTCLSRIVTTPPYLKQNANQARIMYITIQCWALIA